MTLGLSDYQARITKFGQNPNGNIGTYYVGQKLGEIWGYITDGYFKTDADQSWNQKFLFGGQWLAGDIKYKDLNGDGKIDQGDNTIYNSGDRRIIGNATPRYQYSINLDFQYKNFDMTIFLQGVGKADWMPAEMLSGDTPVNGMYLHRHMLDNFGHQIIRMHIFQGLDLVAVVISKHKPNIFRVRLI